MLSSLTRTLSYHRKGWSHKFAVQKNVIFVIGSNPPPPVHCVGFVILSDPKWCPTLQPIPTGFNWCNTFANMLLTMLPAYELWIHKSISVHWYCFSRWVVLLYWFIPAEHSSYQLSTHTQAVLHVFWDFAHLYDHHKVMSGKSTSVPSLTGYLWNEPTQQTHTTHASTRIYWTYERHSFDC